MPPPNERVPQPPPKPFDVQLVGVSVYDIRTRRRRRRRADADRPIVESWLQPHEPVAADEGVFTVLAGADVRYAVSDQAVTIHCAVVGLFRHEANVSEQLLARFQHRESLVLLWPYVRAAVGEIGHMMDLGLPPLPTLDVMALIESAEAGAAAQEVNEPARPRRRSAKASPQK